MTRKMWTTKTPTGPGPGRLQPFAVFSGHIKPRFSLADIYRSNFEMTHDFSNGFLKIGNVVTCI